MSVSMRIPDVDRQPPRQISKATTRPAPSWRYQVAGLAGRAAMRVVTCDRVRDLSIEEVTLTHT